jgi:hypothetical protein
MEWHKARKKVHQYIDLLNRADLSSQKRTAIAKLLIQEEDRFGHSLEQLDFAESLAAAGRARLKEAEQMLEAATSPDRASASRVVAKFVATQHLLDSFCHKLRMRVRSRNL